jgi:hypothetical protein
VRSLPTVRRKPLAAVFLCLLAFAGGRTIAGAAPTAKSLTAKETIRAYIAAINAKNGPKLCALLHPVEARAVGAYLAAIYSSKDHPLAPVPCRTIAGSIGSGGGRENERRWSRAKIVRLRAPHPSDGGVVWVDATLRDTYDDSSPDRDLTHTRFYLARYQGRWVILRHSSALNRATWSEVLDAADAPPATREPRAEDVQIPAGTACDAPVATGSDPLGDERAAGAPWLDIRGVSATDGARLCVTVTFEAPLQPGTEIDVVVGDSSSSGATLYILGDGRVYDDTHEDHLGVAGKDFGLLGDRTLVMRFPNPYDKPLDPKQLEIIVDTIGISEPLIKTQPKMLGGDYYSGRA